MFDSAGCLIIALIQFSLIITKKDSSSRTPATPPIPLRPITSHFCLTPHPTQSGSCMYITPILLSILFSWKSWNLKNFKHTENELETATRDVPRKSFLKKFCIIQRKTPVLGSLLIKLQVFRPTILFKKRLKHRCLPVNIAKLLRTATLENIREWLLLLNLINMCVCHIFTVQCTNIKYVFFHLCVNVPSRLKRTFKTLHLKANK